MSGTRDENVFMARLAEQAERYEDMVEYMKRVASMGAELSLEERNLLSVAFKNAVGCRRSAWRAISALNSREAVAERDPNTVAAIDAYRRQVEDELNKKCHEILHHLRHADQALIVTASQAEAKVFYLKMEGDYHRYLAEFSTGDMQAAHAKNAEQSYSQAFQIAQESLAPTHPIRLGLALNFSVFHFEVLNDPSAACKLAKASFDEAIRTMDSLDEDQYKDSATIMQLLKDNLALWQSDPSMHGGDVGACAPQDGTIVEDF